MSKAAFLASILAVSSAATITWTGIVNDQQWGTVNNWYPAQVPGPNDDVQINDAEGKDAIVVLTSPTTIGVRSMTVGTSAGSKSRVRVLCPLSVSTEVVVGYNGVLEVNSGAANLTATTLTVEGEWDFWAGRFTGNATVSGIANFGQQSAKVFDTAVVRIQSKQPVIAGGSVQFRNNSHVEATTGITASGPNFQCIVADQSTTNSFMALGFSWQQ
eukprot:TRINITY_DN3972_c0_g1_i1.p1 TRINITY_DN3972_c0_g1~~TRINITY_DN3972_c0_g1_i1.p1  ORF type:complete len:215 (+),score=47.71 TRINITY_DN3972_c0_g1_i1:89-733(+)